MKHFFLIILGVFPFLTMSLKGMEEEETPKPRRPFYQYSSPVRARKVRPLESFPDSVDPSSFILINSEELPFSKDDRFSLYKKGDQFLIDSKISCFPEEEKQLNLLKKALLFYSFLSQREMISESLKVKDLGEEREEIETIYRQSFYVAGYFESFEKFSVGSLYSSLQESPAISSSLVWKHVSFPLITVNDGNQFGWIIPFLGSFLSNRISPEFRAMQITISEKKG